MKSLRRWARRRCHDHTFLFKYEEDTPDLLHIYVRHLTQPVDAIKAIFSGKTTWNERHQRYETVSETHTVYWIWLDEQVKKVLVITCFTNQGGVYER